MKPLFNLIVFSAAFLFVSCHSGFYSKEDFASVKKIDGHIHYQSTDDAFTVQAKLDNFKLVDVNLDGSGIGMTYKDSAGKFIFIDNPRFDPLIEYIIKQDKAILGHFGESKNCWLPFNRMTVGGDSSYFAENPIEHMYLHPEKPSYQELMDARDRFVKKHPDIRFIGAHLGSLEWSVDELAKELDKFPNMAVDLAARLVHLQLQSITDYKKVRDFMIKYQNRLLYGTDQGFSQADNPGNLKKTIHEVWLDQWRSLVTDETMTSGDFKGEFKGMKLPKPVVDKLYTTNAEKWYKLNQE